MCGETAGSSTICHSKSLQVEADGLGREAEQLGAEGQVAADRGGDAGDIARVRQAHDRAVDVEERLIGFEEEIARERELADAAVGHLEIDDDELAAGNLVLTVHGSSVVATAREPADGGSGTGRESSPSLPLINSPTSLPTAPAEMSES
jgi:hypothetical protein